MKPDKDLNGGKRETAMKEGTVYAEIVLQIERNQHTLELDLKVSFSHISHLIHT